MIRCRIIVDLIKQDGYVHSWVGRHGTGSDRMVMYSCDSSWGTSNHESPCLPPAASKRGSSLWQLSVGSLTLPTFQPFKLSPLGYARPEVNLRVNSRCTQSPSPFQAFPCDMQPLTLATHRNSRFSAPKGAVYPSAQVLSQTITPLNHTAFVSTFDETEINLFKQE